MLHQLVVAASLDQRLSCAVGVSLENNSGIIMIFAEHGKIKGNILLITINLKKLINFF